MFKKGTKNQVQSYSEIITFKCINTKQSAEMESKTDKKARMVNYWYYWRKKNLDFRKDFLLYTYQGN